MADDLVAGGVEDGRLALEDRDERVARVADLEEHVADLGGPLLAVLASVASCAAERVGLMGMRRRLRGCRRRPARRACSPTDTMARR